jgi:parvulin-like peptidyl-prolyl isomerase
VTLLRRWSFAALACIGTACATGDPDTIVARVGDVAITRADVELHLSVNLIPVEENESGTADQDRVKSRLFDALLDETILVIEAERQGLEVSDAEIDAGLAAVSDGEAADAGSAERQRRLARKRLLVQALMEHVLARLPPANEADLRRQAARARGPEGSGKRVRLRALRFDSVERAAEAEAAIREGRMSFAEAVLTYETGLGQGVPAEVSWVALSPEIREALAGLGPAGVSRPVASNGEIYLFQVDAWLTASNADGGTSRRDQDGVRSKRSRLASDALLEALRRRTPVEVHERRLPFRYVR